LPLLSHSTIGLIARSLGLIHASIVIPLPAPTFKVPDAGTFTSEVVPSKSKSLLTKPGEKPRLPSATPLLLPSTSFVLPSPDHQPAIPEGAVTQFRTVLSLVRVTVAVELGE